MSEPFAIPPEPLPQPDAQVSESQPIPETGSPVGWRTRAACRDLDTDLFFPPGDGKTSQEQIEKAKEICGKCAVRAACLEFAVTTRQDAGVWGGQTEEERRRTRRAWSRQKKR